MPFPSASRLQSFLTPYEPLPNKGGRGFAVRVWGADAGPSPDRPLSIELQIFGGSPRLVLLGGSSEGLAIVRQTHDGLEDLDGIVVPWSSVHKLERDPHLVRDLVRVEVGGRAPLLVAVSNHVLLPHNRASAKSLCELMRSPHGDPLVAPALDVMHADTHADTHAATARTA